MATEEADLSTNTVEKNIFIGDTDVTGYYPSKLNNDVDDNSLQENSKAEGTCHALSGFYAQIVVVVAAIMVFTEVLEDSVPLFFFHGYLFTFLVGGSIVFFLGAYVNMLCRKCPKRSRDYEKSEQPKFSMKNMLFSDINIYLRIGSALFGLGTLISSCLEVASVFTVPHPCVDELNLIQPILRGLFSFLQMHFLFMSSKDLVNSFGWFRHIALMHLVATNLAIWLRIMLWESANHWLDAHHYKYNISEKFSDRDVLENYTVHMLESDILSLDKIKHKEVHTVNVVKNCFFESKELGIRNMSVEPLLAYHLCIQNSTIGDIWEKATPYMYPFIVQYSLVAAAVIYITWANLNTHRFKLQRFSTVSVYGKDQNQDEMNCGGSTKGLLFGLFMLVAGIIAIILFFVLAKEKDFNVHFMVGALECGIFVLSIFVSIVGLVQIQKMKSKTSRDSKLSELIQKIGMLAVYFYGICNIIVGGTSITKPESFLLFVDGSLMVIQASLQSLFIYQVTKKRLGPLNIDEKPGREAVMFLVFSNIVLWMLETFTTQKHVRSQLQLQFYGDVAWPVITHVVLPFVMFYRFHSAVALLDAWRKSYRVKKN